MKYLKSKEWWEAAGTRAIRTFAQAFLAVAGTGVVGLGEINWMYAVSVGVTAAIISVVTSLAGLPEVEE